MRLEIVDGYIDVIARTQVNQMIDEQSGVERIGMVEVEPVTLF